MNAVQTANLRLIQILLLQKRNVEAILQVANAELIGKLEKKEVVERKADLVAPHERRRARVKKIYDSALHKLLSKIKREMLAKVKAFYHPEEAANVEVIPVAEDFMFRLQDFEPEFLTAMREAGRSSFMVATRGIAKEFGGKLGRQTVTESGLIDEFLNRRENKLKAVPTEIYDQINRQLKEGALAGESEAHLADRIRDMFDDLYEGRAETIARTEVGSVYGEAQFDSVKQAGFPYKKWVTASDGRVRDAHAKMDGVVVPVDQPFEVVDLVMKGGIPIGRKVDRVMYPSDPSGAAWNVINCRCIVQAVEGPES